MRPLECKVGEADATAMPKPKGSSGIRAVNAGYANPEIDCPADINLAARLCRGFNDRLDGCFDHSLNWKMKRSKGTDATSSSDKRENNYSRSKGHAYFLSPGHLSNPDELCHASPSRSLGHELKRRRLRIRVSSIVPSFEFAAAVIELRDVLQSYEEARAASRILKDDSSVNYFPTTLPA